MISPTSHWSFRLEILHQIGEVLNFGIDRKRFCSVNTICSMVLNIPLHRTQQSLFYDFTHIE